MLYLTGTRRLNLEVDGLALLELFENGQQTSAFTCSQVFTLKNGQRVNIGMFHILVPV